MKQKNSWITIPNLLSILRLLLIPVFIIFYFCEFENHLWYSIIVVVVSGLTDILDGFIARHFNMISDVGKILDPAADKLTQAAVLICLCIHHFRLIPLLIILVIKELCQLTGALILAKGNNIKPPQARWWGKACTVVLFLTMIVIVLSDIFPDIPAALPTVLIIISAAGIVLSFTGYYVKIYRELRKNSAK